MKTLEERYSEAVKKADRKPKANNIESKMLLAIENTKKSAEEHQETIRNSNTPHAEMERAVIKYQYCLGCIRGLEHALYLVRSKGGAI